MPLTDISMIVYPDSRHGHGNKTPNIMTTNVTKLEPSGQPAAVVPRRLPATHGLYKYQYQKWQTLPNFERKLRLLKQAERLIVGSSTQQRHEAQHNNNSAATAAAASSSSTPFDDITAMTLADLYGGGALEDSQQLLVQVQRLDGQDSKYFGYAPKHAKRDLVICNMCKGYYTKVGFNNHMKLKHPHVWESISAKLSANSTIELCNPTYGLPNDAAITVDGVGVGTGSPAADMSGTISSCSNASSSCSSSLFNSTMQQKLQTTTSKSSKSYSSRHKSSKSSSSSTHAKGSNSSSSAAAPSNGHARSSSSSKSSKHHHATSSSSSTTADKRGSGSSSSKSGGNSHNGSKSKKILPTAANTGLLLPQAPTSKDLCFEKVNEPVPTPLSLSAETKSKHKSSTSSSGSHSSKHKKKGKSTPTDAAKLTTAYESERSSHKSKSHHKSTKVSAKPIKPADYQPLPPTLSAEFQAALPPPPTAQNTADENSIGICIEEMLDPNILNELLSNTQESDLQFDESVLDPGLQANESNSNGYGEPDVKRLRFDNALEQANGSSNYATIYNQQQYADSGLMEDIKLLDQHDQLLAQQGTQQSGIAAQLQQLLYRQQHNVYAYESAGGGQQQQLPANASLMPQFNVCNVNSLTDDNTDSNSLPNYIYMLDPQSQQQVITEFLADASFNNVHVPPQIASGSNDPALANTAIIQQSTARTWHDLGLELTQSDLAKLDTAQPQLSSSQTANVLPVTIKSEAEQPQRKQVSADVYCYASVPRQTALDTFGLVKIPHSNAVLFRRQLITARKTPHTIWPTHGAPAPSMPINNIVGRHPAPGSGPRHAAFADSLQPGRQRQQAAGAGQTAKSFSQTIYVNKSSVVPNEQIKCMKLTMVPRNEYNNKSIGAPQPVFTAKKLSDLLSGKLKEKPIILRLPDAASSNGTAGAGEQQPAAEQVAPGIARVKQFYEKRYRLLRTAAQLRAQQQKRQRHGRRNPLRQNSVTNQIIRQFHKMRRDKQAKSRVLRTINECGINSTANQWKICNNNNNNNTNNNSNSTNAAVSNNGDLMRV